MSRRLSSSGLYTAGSTCSWPLRARQRGRNRRRGRIGQKNVTPSHSRLEPTLWAWERAMNVRVGLIVGREWSFPPKFIEEVNRRDRGVVAEYVTLGGEAMDATSPYRVI